MRILLASDTYAPDINGAAEFSRRLGRGLAQKGHEVAIVAPSLNFHDSVQQELPSLTVFRVRSLAVKPVHPYFRVIARPGLGRVVRNIAGPRFAADIIHIQNHFFLGRAALKASKRLGIPIVGTNHFMPENLLQVMPRVLENQASEILWEDFLRIYEQLDCVVAPSETALQMLRRIGLHNEARAISNGIDLRLYRDSVHEAGCKVLARFGIASKRPILLSTGRLERDKNLDTVLQALALLRATNDFRQIFTGVGKMENELRSLCRQLGLDRQVTFTGRLSDDDLRALYRVADVYIAAGSAELQGISVMEAMASGLPVLAANAVALPELVHDGVNGYLFEIDARDVCDKIRLALYDRKRLSRMSAASRRIIAAHGIDVTVRSYEQLYHEAIARSRQPALQPAV